MHVAVDDEVLLSSATAAAFCTPFCPPIPPPLFVVVVLLCFALFLACRCSCGTKVQLTRGCNAAQLVDTGRQTVGDSQSETLAADAADNCKLSSGSRQGILLH